MKTTVDPVQTILDGCGDPGSVARFAELALNQVCAAIEADAAPTSPLQIVFSYRSALNKTPASLAAAIGEDIRGHLEDLIDARIEDHLRSRPGEGTRYGGLRVAEEPPQKKPPCKAG